MRHNGKEVKILHFPFPAGMRGNAGLITDCGTCYKIAIDSTRSPQAQRYALAHELAHLFLDHLDQHNRPVREQEREADLYAWHYYRQWKRLQAR